MAAVENDVRKKSFKRHRDFKNAEAIFYRFSENLASQRGSV